MEWLLDHGMDANLPGDRGSTGIHGAMTPLHALAQRGRYDETVIEMMETLVTRGAVVEPFVLEFCRV